MKPARLLRWYPRAWREQYGEELLALIQDTLDEGGPTWRLRLGVAWGGLRERVHQAGQAAKAAIERPTAVSRWLTIFVAGSVLGLAPQWFKTSPPPRGSDKQARPSACSPRSPCSSARRSWWAAWLPCQRWSGS